MTYFNILLQLKLIDGQKLTMGVMDDILHQLAKVKSLLDQPGTVLTPFHREHFSRQLDELNATHKALVAAKKSVPPTAEEKDILSKLARKFAIAESRHLPIEAITESDLRAAGSSWIFVSDHHRAQAKAHLAATKPVSDKKAQARKQWELDAKNLQIAAVELFNTITSLMIRLSHQINKLSQRYVTQLLAGEFQPKQDTAESSDAADSERIINNSVMEQVARHLASYLSNNANSDKNLAFQVSPEAVMTRILSQLSETRVPLAISLAPLAQKLSTVFKQSISLNVDVTPKATACKAGKASMPMAHSGFGNFSDYLPSQGLFHQYKPGAKTTKAPQSTEASPVSTTPSSRSWTQWLQATLSLCQSRPTPR